MAVVALLSTSSGVCGAPVEVTDYAGLVGIVGTNDDYMTGERFNRYDTPPHFVRHASRSWSVVASDESPLESPRFPNRIASSAAVDSPANLEIVVDVK